MITQDVNEHTELCTARVNVVQKMTNYTVGHKNVPLYMTITLSMIFITFVSFSP